MDESGNFVQLDDDANVDVGGGSTGVDAKILDEQQNMPGAGPTDDFDGSKKDSGAVGDVATSSGGEGTMQHSRNTFLTEILMQIMTEMRFNKRRTYLEILRS